MKREPLPFTATRIALMLAALLLPVTASAQRDSATPCSCQLIETNAAVLTTLLVDGTRVSSGFGPRMNPVVGNPEIHTGVDIAAPLGTPIHAAADGVISIAWLCGTYGNYVRILHGNGIATGYAHASRFARGIYSGARVTAGQIIAYVGSTGLSTGPHLHYEVLVKGFPVKPFCSCPR